MKKILLMTSCVFVLGACSEGTKESLGLVNTPPDEFAVVTRAPLSVPPDYALRPPRPGAERPMEISTTDQARQTIFGISDMQGDNVSTKEDAEGFLGRLGADNADPNIRAVIDAEGTTDNRTTAERLLFLKSRQDAEGDPINPNEEFERLKQEGVIATKKRNEEIEAP